MTATPTRTVVDERADPLAASVLTALDTVVDPELDEPITDLGFVRTVTIDDTGVEVHLRLPTSFCSPNFAYLMASDAQDALRAVPGIGVVRVALDDHHDSDKINTGLAADAGYIGTFGVEAQESLDELRAIFKRKAHTAALERSCMRLLTTTDLEVSDLPGVTVADLPDHPTTRSLLRRRRDVGLSQDPSAPVFVDDEGRPVPEDEVPMKLRFARSVRVSIEGNAHFCRGLLATRYDDVDGTGPFPRITNTRSTS